MSAAQHEALFTEPDLRVHVLKFVGGSAAVTKVHGKGMSIAYTATGRVTVTWSADADPPGRWIGVVGHGFEGTTPGDVDLFKLVAETYDSSTRTVVLNLYESGSLADLAAAEWCTVQLAFSEGAATF